MNTINHPYVNTAKYMTDQPIETPLYRENGDLFPCSLEHATLCVQQIDAISHLLNCKPEEVYDRFQSLRIGVIGK